MCRSTILGMLKNIYVSEDDKAVWDEAVKMAKDHGMSVSKMILGELKRTLRERQGASVPLGFAVPASMKDPKLVAAEKTADHVRDLVLEALLAEDAES